ncbi:hypothetical protein BDA99DRAFT_517966 [Phascolomyces articulosus]|uniref:AMP-dependent synthetase/ligase domain-containing protein n=1 Tax=Phascolomyces articulosus TaxID=60185 RepID=A0AAD5K4R1_9FUNG|nr:hypothetical protein BDA99DRAFT_517966 [Phascolomyces articulosus]
MAAIKDQSEDMLSKYTDYDSLHQFYEACVNRYRDNVFIRYKVPNAFEFKTLTYSQVDIIVTHLANRWKSTLRTTKSNNNEDNHNIETTKLCIAVLTDNPTHAVLTFFAALKLGYIYFCLSFYNSQEAIVYLLKESSTCFLVTSEANREIAIKCTNTLGERDGVHIQVDDDPFDIDGILSQQESNPVMQQSSLDNEQQQEKKHQATFKENPLDTVAYMHTSGSTGLPKLIPCSTQSMLFSILGHIIHPNQQQNSGDLSSRPEELPIMSTDTLAYSSTVFISHAEYVFLIPIMLAGASVLLFDGKPLAPSKQLEAIKECGVTCMIVLPFDLVAMSEYLESVADRATNQQNAMILQSLKFCLYYGAPLQISTGDYLRSKGMNLQSMYGTTETSGLLLSNLSKNNNRWYDFTPSPALMHYATFEPYGDNLYHLVIHNDYPSLAKGFGNRPNGDFATNDLFAKNVQESLGNFTSWTHIGRIDDAINISYGSKVLPRPIEDEIRREDIVQQCIVIGNNRKCTAVLVELDYEKAM